MLKRLVVVAMVLTLGISLVLWKRDVSERAENGRRSESQGASTEDRPPVSTPGQVRTQPLPADDQPIVAYHKQLEARIRQGDRAAACRLGYDVALCHDRPLLKSLLDKMISFSAQQNRAPTEQEVAKLSELQALFDRSTRLCEGLPIEVRAEGWKHLARAAELGHAEAAVRFAIMPPLDATNFLDDFDGWTYYREHAYRLVESAAARGNIHALRSLRAYALGKQRLARTSKSLVDPVKALAAGMAELPQLGAIEADQLRRTLERERSLLTSVQIREAERLAERWRFNAVPPASDKFDPWSPNACAQ